MTPKQPACAQCGASGPRADLRPFGPEGSPICPECFIALVTANAEAQLDDAGREVVLPFPDGDMVIVPPAAPDTANGEAKCCTCWKPAATVDIRPYGPGGALICYPCATATPESDAAAQAAYKAQLDAAMDAVRVAGTGTVVLDLGDNAGPRPVVRDPEDLT